MTDAPSLFRPEAVAYRGQRLTGEAMLVSPPPFRLAVLGLTLLAGAAMAILGSATFTRSEAARGVLLPPGGLAEATALVDGTLERFVAREGDPVEAGEPIAVVRAPSGTLVLAPATGTVALLRVPVGGAVTAGQAVAMVRPGGALVADLALPADAVGSVEPGQAVRLRYDAFPFQRFGAGEGIVDAVSEVTIPPGDLPPGLDQGGPSYRVRVTLAPDDGPLAGRLRPGMTLDADIILGRRGVLGWLLGPLGAGEP